MYDSLSPAGETQVNPKSFVRPFAIDTTKDSEPVLEPKKPKRSRINTDLIHNRQTNDLVRKLKLS